MSVSADTDVSPRIPMDPRIRQRRIEVTRAAGRRRLRVLVAGVALIAVVAAAYSVSRSRLLDVDNVRVRGAAHTAPADVAHAASLDGRRQMVDINPDRVARAVERLPWVASAVVTRRWPSSVDIAIRERSPVAVIHTDEGGWYVDTTGRLLGPAAPETTLPVIRTGADVLPDPAAVAGSVVPEAIHPVAVVRAFGADAGIAAVTVADSGTALELESGVRVLLGPGPNDDVLPAQALALMTLARKTDLGRVAVIDLRVPAAPAVSPG